MNTRSRVVVIGNFDGVHRGHREVLSEASQCGRDHLSVITFWPHPLAVLRPEHAPKLLSDLHTRIELLREAGANEVRVVRFTPEVANLSPAQFVDRFVLPLAPERVVVGENFRFGKRAVGDVEALAELGRGHFEVLPLPLARVAGEVSCSTGIRERLAQGRVAEAAEHLGRSFRFRGVVVVGDQRGRELGFPTANLIVAPELAVPADGVYAGWLTQLDVPQARRLPAAISVGSNPTFDGSDRRVETHVIGRTDLELYGSDIAVDFVDRIRGQVRFDSADSLIIQMQDDVAATTKILGGR